MKRALAIGLLIGATLAAPALSQPDQPLIAPECAALPEALRGCTPASCQQPHPFLRNFMITHAVAGPDGEACGYSQTMPGEMAMACRFSEAGRSEYAGVVEEMLAGRMSGATSAPESAMTRECEIRDRNGAVVPWGNSSR